jgi:glutamyl/glutaminyl-tRNA synthetase
MDADKLAWIAQQHVAAQDPATLAGHVAPFLDRERFPAAVERLEAVVDALHTRLGTYHDINIQLELLYPEDSGALEAARADLAADPEATSVLKAVAGKLAAVEPWGAEAAGQAVRDAGAAAGARGAALFHPVRRALIGSEKGPDLGKILAALGRNEALRRIKVHT